MLTGRRIATALPLLIGCVNQPQPAPLPYIVPAAAEAFVADSIATGLVRRALAADAAATPADSLYADQVEIFADGEVRTEAPRLAGLRPGGSVQVAQSRSGVTGQFVWTTIAYRWWPGTGGGALVEGRATFIIGRQRDGAWRILHLHSSTTPPPDTTSPAPAPDGAGAGGADPTGSRGWR